MVIKRITSIFKVLIFAYIITGLLLLLGAFVMYKFGLEEKFVRLITFVIYGVSTIVSGFVYIKIHRTRRIPRGALIGLVYYLLLLVISCIINRSVPQDIGKTIISLAICILGGIIGSLLG